MKITVVGAGYVGISNAVLLAQHNDVIAFDVDEHKVAMLNERKSPIEDAHVSEFLQQRELKLTATSDKNQAFADAQYVIIATPTDYDPQTNYFNTETVETVIREVQLINPSAVMVIKSTVPVGYTSRIIEQFNCPNLMFSREWLRFMESLHASSNFYRQLFCRTAFGARCEV